MKYPEILWLQNHHYCSLVICVLTNSGVLVCLAFSYFCLNLLISKFLRHGDGAGNTTEENSIAFSP